ncbi:MAG: 4-alpha-glucanotransferase, partial [Oscillospiraceae bacterium]|nr:4-alpha-glucanotransferase [Oscillospiraceae bacterium]
MQRSSGVLMHITSLPAPYGIGTLGDPAKSFLDFLSYAGQKWWQVLPIHPVGYGASPYQPSCSFAGNTLLIDLDELRKSGLLTRDFLESLPWGDDPSLMDFETVCQSKDIALRAAFSADPDAAKKAAAFADKHFGALDFALYTALKAENEDKAWYQWEDDLKLRDAQAIGQAKERLEDEI